LGSVVHTWGGSGDDVVNAITIDSDGNTWLTGYTESFTSKKDALLLKYDSGNLIFVKTWDGFEDTDMATDISSDSSGNIYITGTTGRNNYPTFLLKYNPDGELLWQKTWSKNTVNRGESLALDSSGNIYITGTTGSYDVFLLKYNPDGELLWQKTWGGEKFDGPFSLIVDSDDIYIVGKTASYGIGLCDAFILKLTTDGELEWQTTFGEENHFACINDLALDSSGIYSAGYYGGLGGPETALFLKTDFDGNLIFAKTWYKGNGDTAEAITLASDGIYIAGTTTLSSGSDSDALLLKYDFSGNLNEAKIWGSGNEKAYDITFNHGALYIAGFALNSYGDWQETDGWTEEPSLEKIIPNTSLYDLNGNQGIVDGTENSYEGIEDTGAGKKDALFIKLLK